MFGIEYTGLSGSVSVLVAYSATSIQLWKPMAGTMTVSVSFATNNDFTTFHKFEGAMSVEVNFSAEPFLGIFALEGAMSVRVDFLGDLSTGPLWNPQTPEDDGWSPVTPEQGIWTPITPVGWN